MTTLSEKSQLKKDILYDSIYIILKTVNYTKETSDSDGFTGVHTSDLIKQVHFILCQLYINTTVFKKCTPALAR